MCLGLLRLRLVATSLWCFVHGGRVRIDIEDRSYLRTDTGNDTVAILDEHVELDALRLQLEVFPCEFEPASAAALQAARLRGKQAEATVSVNARDLQLVQKVVPSFCRESKRYEQCKKALTAAAPVSDGVLSDACAPEPEQLKSCEVKIAVRVRMGAPLFEMCLSIATSATHNAVLGEVVVDTTTAPWTIAWSVTKVALQGCLRRAHLDLGSSGTRHDLVATAATLGDMVPALGKQALDARVTSFFGGKDPHKAADAALGNFFADLIQLWESSHSREILAQPVCREAVLLCAVKEASTQSKVLCALCGFFGKDRYGFTRYDPETLENARSTATQCKAKKKTSQLCNILADEAEKVAAEIGSATNAPTSLVMRDRTVLVVGAGPVGLWNALVLARRGAKVIVVEKRSDFTRPQAIVFKVTKELLQFVGLAQFLPESLGGKPTWSISNLQRTFARAARFLKIDLLLQHEFLGFCKNARGDRWEAVVKHHMGSVDFDDTETTWSMPNNKCAPFEPCVQGEGRLRIMFDLIIDATGAHAVVSHQISALRPFLCPQHSAKTAEPEVWGFTGSFTQCPQLNSSQEKMLAEELQIRYAYLGQQGTYCQFTAYMLKASMLRNVHPHREHTVAAVEKVLGGLAISDRGLPLVSAFGVGVGVSPTSHAALGPLLLNSNESLFVADSKTRTLPESLAGAPQHLLILGDALVTPFVPRGALQWQLNLLKYRWIEWDKLDDAWNSAGRWAALEEMTTLAHEFAAQNTKSLEVITQAPANLLACTVQNGVSTCKVKSR